MQVTPSAIANYENGISYPKPDIFVALMITLEVDANYFYEEYVRNREIAIACKRAITQDEIYALEKYRQVDEQREKTCSYGDRRRVFENAGKENWISFRCMKIWEEGLNAICKKEQNILNSVYARRI